MLFANSLSCLKTTICEAKCFFVKYKLKVGFQREGFWVDYQVSPKLMAPMHSGLTLTAAEGESKRCLASRDLGGGAGFIVFRCQMQMLD